MKNIFNVTWLASVLFIYTSCITSLHPLVTKDNVIEERRIEGTWISKEQVFKIVRIPDTLLMNILGVENYPNRKNDSLLFSQSYTVTFRKDSINYDFNLALTRFGNNVFMNIGPAGFEPKIDPNAWMKKYGQMLKYLPTYTIAKLEIQNHLLVIRFLNGSFIKEQVQKGKLRINHESNDLFEMFLITASSSELQQFFIKYGNDERLYSNENTVILKRRETDYVSKKNTGQ